MARSLNENQLAALRAVADGRIQWGSASPVRDRRQGVKSMSVFLIDGAEVYGARKATFSALARRGLIRERVEDVETVSAQAEERQYRNIAGFVHTHHLPVRQVPADPGWRVAVEITTAGRAALSGDMRVATDAGSGAKAVVDEQAKARSAQRDAALEDVKALAALAAFGNMPVRFWVCPVLEHRDRPCVTVEWREGVAHCTSPGCAHSSAEQR